MGVNVKEIRAYASQLPAMHNFSIKQVISHALALGCDILAELRAIRDAGDRVTLTPPCPDCQGIYFHQQICRHFDPRIDGARDKSFMPNAAATKTEVEINIHDVLAQTGHDNPENVAAILAAGPSQVISLKAGNAGRCPTCEGFTHNHVVGCPEDVG